MLRSLKRKMTRWTCQEVVNTKIGSGWFTIHHMLLESSGGRDGMKLVQPKSVVLRMAAGIGVLPLDLDLDEPPRRCQSLYRRPLYVAPWPKRDVRDVSCFAWALAFDDTRARHLSSMTRPKRVIMVRGILSHRCHSPSTGVVLVL